MKIQGWPIDCENLKFSFLKNMYIYGNSFMYPVFQVQSRYMKYFPFYTQAG